MDNRFVCWTMALLLLAASHSAVVADPAPGKSSAQPSPPLPADDQMIEYTLDTTEDIARQLRPGDDVRVDLTACWPIRSTFTLIERCSVAAVGPLKSDQPAGVTLKIRRGSADDLVKRVTRYGSKQILNLQVVPLKSEVRSRPIASLDSIRVDHAGNQTRLWVVTTVEARLTSAGWANLVAKSSNTSELKLTTGEVLIALPHRELAEVLSQIKLMNGELRTRRNKVVAGGALTDLLLENKLLVRGDVASTLISALPHSNSESRQPVPSVSMQQPQLGLWIWPGDDHTVLMEATIQRYRASTKSGALGTDGKSIKTVVPLTAADALIIGTPYRSGVLDDLEWAVCAIQVEPMPSEAETAKDVGAEFTSGDSEVAAVVSETTKSGTLLNEGTNEISLAEGAVTSLRTSTRMKKVVGFDAQIVTALVESPYALQVQAHGAGRTSMEISDENQHVYNVEVEVKSPAQAELAKLLSRLFPDAQVEVIPVRDALLLRGEVADEQQLLKIVEIAALFTTQVVNHVEVRDRPSGRTSDQIPKGKRVLTVRVAVESAALSQMHPGDRVDVLVTYSQSNPQGRMHTTTKTLLEYVEVLSLGPVPNTPPDERLSVAGLLLTPEQVSFVKLAESMGELTLVRRGQNAEVPESAGTIDDKLLDELRELDTVKTTHTREAPTKPTSRKESESKSPTLASTLQSTLLKDIHTLHEDVRRLIELLEKRRAGENQPIMMLPSPRRPASNASSNSKGPTHEQGRQLLYFGASWCTPCQTMRPRMWDFDAEGSVDRVVDIDAERDRSAMIKHRVEALPTFIYRVDGREINRHTGVMTLDELREFVSQPKDEPAESVEELGLKLSIPD